MAATIELTCSACSCVFSRKASGVRTGTIEHFCSRACRVVKPVTLECQVCGAEYQRKPLEAVRSRWCSYRCAGLGHVAMRSLNGPSKGERRSTATEFKPGLTPTNKAPVGTVTIRTRHKRGGERRAWVKVAEPNVWRERYRVVWEQAHGPAPRGMVIHHIDHDPLNDDIGNLMLMTRAEHASHHSGDVPDRFRTGLHAAPPNSDA